MGPAYKVYPLPDKELQRVLGDCTCIPSCVEGFLHPQQGLLGIDPVQVSQQAGTQGASAASAAPAVHVDLLACFQPYPDLCGGALYPAKGSRQCVVQQQKGAADVIAGSPFRFKCAGGVDRPSPTVMVLLQPYCSYSQKCYGALQLGRAAC